MVKIKYAYFTAWLLFISFSSFAETYNVNFSAEENKEHYRNQLPDISGFNKTSILEKQKKWSNSANVELERIINNVATRKFFKGGKLGLWAEKQGQFPKAIFVRDGILSLDELNNKLPDALVKKNNKQYLLRYPLVIMNHAALKISPGQELLLSHERGSFLVNAGSLFIIDGALRGWSEKNNSPAKFDGNKKEYRPFYIGWSGSETYAYGSLIESLGSLNSKAYGFTLSTYTEQDEMYAPTELNRNLQPIGWLINNRVTDVYYGFYSYEASDVVIIGNKYYDNIYYGIDPHDHSHRLIIANNEVWGTKVRHGIIGSRDVSKSYIFGNNTHDNKLAGIMLDRACVDNVITNNSSYNNGSDGIAINESNRNLILNNSIYNNSHHGIHFRNSIDINLINNNIVNNGRYGVYGHTSDLLANYDSKSDHEIRDLKLDPYEMRGSVNISNGFITSNKSGAIFSNGLESVYIGKVGSTNNGYRKNIILGGELTPYTSDVAKVWYGDHKAVHFTINK